MTDGELVSLYKSGDTEAFEVIFERYKEKVRGISRSYFLVGGDFDDVLQEGMLGLLKAVDNYDPSQGASFGTFVRLCVGSSIKSAVTRALSDKNRPLNDSIPLSEGLFYAFGVEDNVIDREERAELRQKLGEKLSDYENRVLDVYLAGLSYSEIAEKLGSSEKSIDNAVQRIRKKLQR